MVRQVEAGSLGQIESSPIFGEHFDVQDFFQTAIAQNWFFYVLQADTSGHLNGYLNIDA